MKTRIYLNDEREKQPVPIISDALIGSSGVADGRLGLVLILDTAERPDIVDLVKVHATSGPGDATSVWHVPSRFRPRDIQLILSFQKPQKCVIVVEWNIADSGGLVDQIVRTEVVYLQPGKPGDRLKNTMDAPRIFVEVPSTHFVGKWNTLWPAEFGRSLKRQGFSRTEIKDRVPKFIAEWRELTDKRMQSP